jgi:AcrR family transcriptional regulator
MEVSLDLFSGSHFSSITIKDIARETGFNSALLYYYFDSKEDLFRQSVEMAVRRVFEQFVIFNHTIDTPPTVVSAWLTTHIQQFDLIRKFVKIALDYAQNGTRIDTIDDAIASFYENERTLLSSSIARGVSDQLFSRIDPDETATFISTFLDGVVTRSIIFPGFEYSRSILDLKRILEQHLCCQLPALLS